MIFFCARYFAKEVLATTVTIAGLYLRMHRPLPPKTE